MVDGGRMDRLVKWALGCAVWMILCSGAQAGLIDSVRVGDKAYLLSDSHLYLYDAPGGSVVAERTAAFSLLFGHPGNIC